MISMDRNVAPLFKHFKLKKNIFSKTTVILFLVVLILTFAVSYNRSSIYFISISRRPSDTQLFKCKLVGMGNIFLWYAPHSGFSNQLLEFKNAVLMASILNRTLIVPPVLDHHAVALGSCPKFRVLEPSKLRLAVWVHAIELIKNGRYVSIADIVDIRPLLSTVRFIDLRDFISVWCGLPLNFYCLLQSSHESRSLTSRLQKCGAILSGSEEGPTGCVHHVNQDCRTVVWTFSQNDGAPDRFQLDHGLNSKNKPVFLRKRRDLLRALGPCSEAGSFPLLAFGSLFSAPYRNSEMHIDLNGARRDHLLLSIIKKTESLLFSPEILRAGEELASEMGSPFFCAQLRLLDGQFKKHWRVTFLGLRQELEKVVSGGPHLPVTVFLMTDLPERNWSGTYLQNLAQDTGKYSLRMVGAENYVVVRTAMEMSDRRQRKWYCGSKLFPNILLYVQEVVCGCADLGFYGTAGSTIAQTVETMRRINSTCLPFH